MPLGHIGILRPVDQQAKKQVSILVEVAYSDFIEEHRFTMEEVQKMPGIQEKL